MTDWFPHECDYREPLTPDPVENDCEIDVGAPHFNYVGKRIFLPHMPSRVQTTYGPRLMDVYNYGYDIGLCDYPIYDERFRSVLNRLISDHFYTREIGAETVELFVFYLNRKMREIMPIYNIIFKQLANPEFDPFAVDMTTTHTASTHSEGENESTDKTDSLLSNAPQINLEGGNPSAREGYWNTGQFGDGQASSTVESDTLYEYVTNIHGSNVLGYEMMQAFLTSYLNPLNSLFEELEPCFSQLFIDHVNGL